MEFINKLLSNFLILSLSSYASGIDVHIIIGQSNASGRVDSGYTAEAIDASIAYYYDTDGPAGTSHDSEGAFTTLQPQSNGYYGTEISYGRAVASNTTNQVAIIKISAGGKRLYDQWNDTEANGANPLWDTFISESTAAIEALEAGNPGCTINLANVVWIQGESDATKVRYAAAYESIFASFVSSVYAHLATLGDIDSLQFTTSEVGAIKSSKYPEQAKVRSAQEAVMATKGNYHLVETEDLTTSDGVHYDAASIGALGARLAHAYLQAVSTPAAVD